METFCCHPGLVSGSVDTKLSRMDARNAKSAPDATACVMKKEIGK